MPSELNKKMDDLLRRFVKKRREESSPDFELHSITRRILQAEVARAFPKTEAKPSVFRFWPALALIGVFTALFVTTLMILNAPRQRGPSVKMARQSDSSAPTAPQRKMDEKSLAFGVSTGAAESASRLLKSKESQVFSRKQEADATLEVAGVPAPLELPEPGLAGEPSASGRLAAASRNNVSSLAKPLMDAPAEDMFEPATAAVPASASVEPEMFYDNAASSVRRRFVQQDLRANYRQNLLSPAQPKVLESFVVERAENRIRIHDGDGSIYEGLIINPEIQPEEIEGVRITNRSQFAFRVTGTNQTLKELITFTGTISKANGDQNVPAARFEAKAEGSATDDKLKKQIDPAGLVEGKVSVGGTNTFQIQANEAFQ